MREPGIRVRRSDVCCRYYVDLSPELRPIIEEANRSPLADRLRAEKGAEVRTSGDVRPFQAAPVLATSRGGKTAAFPMIWGYDGSVRAFNARVETAAVRPMFRDGWRAHRCAAPATAFFEWEHLLRPDGSRKTGDRYRLSFPEDRVFWLAGLYRMEEDGFPHFTVLTREAADGIRFIHDRMPVLFFRDAAEEWIRPESSPERVLADLKTALVFRKDIPERMMG